YRFIPEEGTLFPQEIEQYEPFSIRETLNNCSDVLSERQKQDKIKNLLQTLKLEGKILPKGKNWELK
ncbi:MAG: hypothetical protein ACM3Q2_18475, partial [Syntrophothermus sp.]